MMLDEICKLIFKKAFNIDFDKIVFSPTDKNGEEIVPPSKR